ncbi:Trypsin family protein with PDZ domain isoform 4 [Gossypium australe]|uniref:Trypsin family protein with PDZ domain isoform 4 n=1 Tax=Gossypium australe TaxID=47621 RepID=A0A5B6VHN2_9ROSI|nr:Trypsin family protein with PDZ domain isoform 4 [Gossypium australe]
MNQSRFLMGYMVLQTLASTMLLLLFTLLKLLVLVRGNDSTFSCIHFATHHYYTLVCVIAGCMRKASFSSGSKSIVRIIAIGAASAGLLYLNNNPDSKATVKLSIPTILREHVPFQGHPSFVSSDHSQFGKFPLFLSRVDPALAGDVAKGAPVAVGDGGKPSCGCLGRDFIANAAAKIAPAVVNLSVQQDLYGFTTVRSMCSGTIIDADGTILTCAHGVVDSQGRQLTTKGKIDVTLQDGRTFEGIVVNSDLHSDIAIVKIKSKTPLPTAKLGSSSKLRPGDWVIAMGTPLSLQNTVTAGIVRKLVPEHVRLIDEFSDLLLMSFSVFVTSLYSCVDRKSSDLGLGGMRREYLQTDCAINAVLSFSQLVCIN